MRVGKTKINFCDIKLLLHQPSCGHREKTSELESEAFDNFSKMSERNRPVTLSFLIAG